MKKQFTLTAIASLLSLSLAVFWKQPVQATTALPDREINITLIGDSYSSEWSGRLHWRQKLLP